MAILEISVFLSQPFWKKITKKNCFASSPWKLVKDSWVARMGHNSDNYPGFQPKITHPKHFCPKCNTWMFPCLTKNTGFMKEGRAYENLTSTCRLKIFRLFFLILHSWIFFFFWITIINPVSTQLFHWLCQ
jgi:hypothetical protein